jgi:hypothetical protein
VKNPIGAPDDIPNNRRIEKIQGYGLQSVGQPRWNHSEVARYVAGDHVVARS